jgi:tetratricopeptide (TPR) repeat protein
MIARRQIGILLLVLSCVLASAQSTSLQRGATFFQQGDYEAALRELKAASLQRPNDASVHNIIGITETKLGRIDEANLEYKTASRLDPTLTGPDKNLGFNYLNRAQYELAETSLQAALALDPTDPFVHYYLSILYLSTSQDTKAVSHISAAQNPLGNDATNGMMAVKLCLKSGHPEEALHIVRLLENELLLSFAQEYEAANLVSNSGRYVEAVPLFRRLVQRQPTSWENKYNLAITLLKAKQPAEAQSLLIRLASERARDANILGMLGSAYDLDGKPILAVKAYQDAIAVDRGNPDRYLDCTRVMVDLNQFDEAAILLQRGLAEVSDPFPLLIRIGAIEIIQGHFDKSRVSFNEAVREHPNIALGYVALAQTYMKEGNDERAISVLRDGRGKVDKDFALEYVLGLTSFEMGQQSDALEALKNSEELGPDVVEPHYQLGMLYMQQNKWSDAQGEFESVLRLDPHHAASFYQLSRTYKRMGNTGKAKEMATEASLLTRTQREEAIKTEQLRFGIPFNHNQP